MAEAKKVDWSELAADMAAKAGMTRLQQKPGERMPGGTPQTMTAHVEPSGRHLYGCTIPEASYTRVDLGAKAGHMGPLAHEVSGDAQMRASCDSHTSGNPEGRRSGVGPWGLRSSAGATLAHSLPSPSASVVRPGPRGNWS